MLDEEIIRIFLKLKIQLDTYCMFTTHSIRRLLWLKVVESVRIRLQNLSRQNFSRNNWLREDLYSIVGLAFSQIFHEDSVSPQMKVCAPYCKYKKNGPKTNQMDINVIPQRTLVIVKTKILEILIN